jgi:hypothetical protein
VIRDVRKHMTKIGFRIKSVELGRTNQAVAIAPRRQPGIVSLVLPESL